MWRSNSENPRKKGRSLTLLILVPQSEKQSNKNEIKIENKQIK